MQPRTVTTSAATQRAFKVRWYEASDVRAIINRGKSPVPLPKKKPKLRKAFEVRARSLDTARRLARQEVAKYGVQVLSVNFTTNKDELIAYSKGVP